MLDPSLADAVAEPFGLGGAAVLTGPVAAGRLGQVWRLTTARGEFAVKDPSFPVSAADLEADAEADAAYQDAVHRSGVPMPAVVRTTAGGVVADVSGNPVRVYTWVDVLPPDRRLDPAAVGRVVAGIHRVAVPARGPVDGWYVDPVGEAGWWALADRLRAEGAPFAERLAELVPDVVAVESILRPPTDTQTCHRDLWADNLLRTPAGPPAELTDPTEPALVVLDWENSGPADPSQELAAVVFEFGCGEPERMREVYAAYLAAGGPGRLEQPGDLTMLVAQTGHIAQEGCRRWLAATDEAGRVDDEARADNAAWVAEFLDEPVTLATVAELLAAAASVDLPSRSRR